MFKVSGKIFYKNLPNIASILGILPLALLFIEDGYRYLIPLIICNNIMDDLDGILAVKLDLKSDFGAMLDNVCDVVAHIIFVMMVGMHYGNICGIVSLAAVVAILLRGVSRMDPRGKTGTGSPTNELVRHMFFVILLAQFYSFNPVPFLIAVLVLNTVSMLVPYHMPYSIRSMTKSAPAIALVNVSLVVAWKVPYATPIIAASFIITYLYSLIAGGITQDRSSQVH